MKIRTGGHLRTAVLFTVLMIHFIIVVFLIQTTFDGLKVASLLADSPLAQNLHHNSSINGRKTENKPNASNRTAPKKGTTSDGSILLKQSADSAVLKNLSNELSSVLPRDSIFNSTARVEKRRDLLASSEDSAKRLARIQTRLDRVAKCLHSGPFTNVVTRLFNVLNFDSSVAVSREAEHHYQQLLKLTAKYRGFPYHDLKGYNGPWIENHFIDTFIGKPLQYFGGLFPLFVQWTDYMVGLKLNRTDFSKKIDDEMIYDEIRQFLRPDLIYIAVAQSNNGLRVFQDIRNIGSNVNVLVLSAGGEGNVAVPLIKGDLAERPFNRSQIEHILGFYGSVENGPRERMLAKVNEAAKKGNETLFMRKSSKWQDDM